MRFSFPVFILIAVYLAACPCAGAPRETFGAEANPTGSPIGGGKGYRHLVTKSTYHAQTVPELLEALGKAKPGEVVYVSDDAELDLTGKQGITIPGEVTLASGRGKPGSEGARLFTTDLGASGLFVTGGPGVRITGLRLQGPDPERRESAYVAPNSNGVIARHPKFEVDNCEISGWSAAGLSLQQGCTGAYIHHNYIHHNQRSGLGYGVCLVGADALIEANLFDWCRHHIAGTGSPGTSYEARYNLVLENANSYSFDMHGGRDRKDGTDIAGTRINIHHNTFRMTDSWGVLICGIPEEYAIVHHNWFLHEDPKSASAQYYGLNEGLYTYRNLFGSERKLLGVAVLTRRPTPVYRNGKVFKTLPRDTELSLLDFRDGKFEVALGGGLTGLIYPENAEIIPKPTEDFSKKESKDLVAHYTFSGTSDKAKDESGRGNDGVVHGAQRVTVDGIPALRFDGIDDWVDCGSKPSMAVEEAGTVMLWFRPAALQGGLLTRSTSSSWDDERLTLMMRSVQNGGDFVFTLANGKTHYTLYLKPPPLGEWSHVAATWDGKTASVYLNGTRATTVRQAFTPEFSEVPLILGRSQGYGEPFYKGLLAELRAYSRPLAAEEIQHHYRKLADRLRPKEAAVVR